MSTPDPIEVLVVDDDEDLRETLELILDNAGFAVSSLQDGRQALDFLRTVENPPVVLLDLRMPHMTGWELIDALRSEGRLDAIPIIICTSSPDDAPAGFDVVAKPVELADLVGALRRAAARSSERAGDENWP